MQGTEVISTETPFMKHWRIWVIVFTGAALLALAGELLQRPKQTCLVDGSSVYPGAKGTLRTKKGVILNFCSVCCARRRLEHQSEKIDA